MTQRNKTGIAGDLLKALARAERGGLTRYRIAKLSGVDQSQLGKIKRGLRMPLLDTAEKIVEAMGCKLVIVENEQVTTKR